MTAERTVLLRTADLLFRAKLESVVRLAGWRAVHADAADVAVVELGREDTLEVVRRLVAQGTHVLAFGPHVHHERLREARRLGAHAVPNSRIQAELARALSER